MKPNPMRAAAVLAAAASSLLLVVMPARAACLTDAEVSAVFDAYSRAEPVANPGELTQADGECSRAKFNRMLGLQLGDPVGYKAGLTNPAVQKRFNATAPVWGTLYGPMLLTNGAQVAANMAVEVAYWGLPGTPRVQVSFK